MFEDYNLNTHQASSKKKKKKKHRQENDESLQDVSTSLYLGEEPDKQDKSHKSRKSYGKFDNICAVEDASVTEHLDAGMKRKKKHSDRSESEDLLMTEPHIEFEGTTERPAKKRKRHSQTCDENLDDNESGLVDSSAEHMSLEGTVKRKKKKTPRISPEDSVNEDILTNEPNVECEDISVKSKKKKKKKHCQEIDENLEDMTASVHLSEETDRQEKSHKSRKSKEKFDNIGAAEDLSFRENGHLVGTLKKKKKKHRRHSDRSESEEPDIEHEGKSERPTKKRKKHHQTLDENLDDNESASGSQKDSTAEHMSLEGTVKRKKKKKCRTPPEDSVNEDILTSEPNVECEDMSVRSKKKKKKKHTQETDESLEDNGSISVTLTENLGKSRKNRKSSECVEDIRHPEESYSEQRHLEVTLKKKKKKMTTNCDRSPTKDIVTTKPHVAFEYTTGTSKKKKKILSLEIDKHLEDNGPTSAPLHEETILREKYHKREKSQTSPSFNDGDLEDMDDLEDGTCGEDIQLEMLNLHMDQLIEGSELESDDGAATSGQNNKSVKNKDGEIAALEQVNEVSSVPSDCTNEVGSVNPKVGKRNQKKSALGIRERDISILEEVFPNVRSLKMSTMRTLLEEDLGRIKDAKEKGISFVSGRFTKAEDDQIRKNVEEFMAATGVESGEMLFHTYRYPEKKKVISRIKRQFHFRLRMCEGVHHCLYEVIKRGLKLYDSNHHKGRFTKEEIEQLKKYSEIYGNKWTTIGPLIGRSAVVTQLRASMINDNFNSGFWSVEETNCLISVMKNYILNSLQLKETDKEPISIPKEKLYKGIPWVNISSQVKTRNWSLCKLKWYAILQTRMNFGLNPFTHILGTQNKITIIKWLHESNLKESWHVKWEELIENLTGNIFPFNCQTFFIKMKVFFVPGWKTLSFPEIVNHLYTETLPVLEEKLDRLYAKHGHPEIPEKRTTYRVGEIFQEYFQPEAKRL